MATRKDGVLILYGSQTGQAKAIAQEVHRDLTEACIEARISCMSCFKDFDLTEESTVVIICSTTGDGDAPETAERFWRQLKRKTLAADHLAHLRFALLGLGDTNYSNFCQMGKNFAKRLPELGASSFMPPVFADDAIGLESFVEPFRSGLLDALRGSTPRAQSEPAAADAALSAQMGTLKVAEEIPLTLPKLPKPLLELQPADAGAAAAMPLGMVWAGYEACAISRFRCLTTQDAVKRTLEMEISLPESIRYQPGDSFSLRCPNTAGEVDELLARLGVQPEQADKPMKLVLVSKSAPLPSHLPAICTLRQALTFYCDLRAVAPKKTLLLTLASHCGNPAEQRALQLLSSRQGADEYMQLCKERATIMDLLSRFPSCHPPVARVLEQLPALPPRFYSAASSPQTSPRSVRFVFNVVSETAPANEPQLQQRPGLCTTWLDTIFRHTVQQAGGEERTNEWVTCPAPGTAGQPPLQDVCAGLLARPCRYDAAVLVQLRASTGLRMPAIPQQPLVLIGPGTGIAPFVGFLEDLALRPLPSPTCHVFFGCRHRERDYLFREFFEALERKRVVSGLHIACSRDEGAPCRYVQDSMRLSAAELVRLVTQENAAVFVCGNAQTIAQGVDSVLIEILQSQANMSKEEAAAYVDGMKQEKRYQREVWA